MGIFSVKKEISPDTIIRRKEDLLFNEIDGEVVMLSVENSEYYGINKVGSRIWELLETPITFKDLLCKIMDEYDVSENNCTIDTLVFLKNLRNKRLIICE